MIEIDIKRIMIDKKNSDGNMRKTERTEPEG